MSTSLGFDLQDLVDRKKLFLDYVYVEPSEIQETGDYDLEGLFIRLQHAVESVGAKRICLDTLEALFSGFSNERVLRAELRRLFRWLKERTSDDRDHGGEGRKHTHAPRTGGIRLRLRHLARSPHPGADFDAPLANREVPGDEPWSR